jgi:hypothetical protein
MAWIGFLIVCDIVVAVCFYCLAKTLTLPSFLTA